MPPIVGSSDEPRQVEVAPSRKRKQLDEGTGPDKKRTTKDSDIDGSAVMKTSESNDEREEKITEKDPLELGFGHDDESDEDEDEDDDEDDDEDEDRYDKDEIDENDESLEEDFEDGSDDYDDFAEWPWLKSITIRIKADNSVDDSPIGFCHAKLINREPIRATFYRDMEEPTHDLSELAFHVFDRWGCLKSKFRDHPVKKGTGIWGAELDESKFLFIEGLKVNEDNQRKGYGRKLFEQAWENAQSIADDCNFAIVLASHINTRVVEEKAESLSPRDRELFYTGLQSAAEDFWRAVGFRRIGSTSYFAYAKDPSHASRSISAADDYRHPLSVQSTSSEDDQMFPYDKAMSQSNDPETLELLKARLLAHPATDNIWLSVDKYGDNIVQAVAGDIKAESLSWLLQLPFSSELQSSRNLKGETPLERLETWLESRRTMRRLGGLTIPMSDEFGSFTQAETICLQLLKGLSNPTPTQLARLAYGCTCGECVGGFLSPRLLFALEDQCETHHYQLNGMLDGSMMRMSGPEWCDWNDHHFCHLDASIKNNFKTNKSLRQGFTNIFGYVAEAIHAKEVPTAINVLQYADGEWPPCTKNYLQRGGTVAAVVLASFDGAMSQDQHLGDGEHQAVYQDDIDKLPKCRNDGEFVFASRQYRALEGLPAFSNAEVETGNTW